MGNIKSRIEIGKGVLQGFSVLTGTATLTINEQVVVGNNTKFLSEVKIGDYFYDDIENKCYRIGMVRSNTELWLDKVATNTYAGSVKVVREFPTSITYTNTTDTAIIVDGLSFEGSVSNMISLDTSIPAITFDATGSSLRIDLFFGY